MSARGCRRDRCAADAEPVVERHAIKPIAGPAAVPGAVGLATVAADRAAPPRRDRHAHPARHGHRAVVRCRARAADDDRAQAARGRARARRRAARERQARLFRGPRHRDAHRPQRDSGPRAPRRNRPPSRASRWSTRRAAEFAAETPYFYSTYAAAGSPPEAPPVARPASLVIGSGPVRIGQGIEFDYCAVQAADALCAAWAAARSWSTPTLRPFRPTSTRRRGCTSSRSTPRSRARGAARRNASTATRPTRSSSSAARRRWASRPRSRRTASPLRGLDLEAIDQTEERMRFAGLVDRLGIPQPRGRHGVVASRRRSSSPSGSATRSSSGPRS